jgi:hypothetical protein
MEENNAIVASEVKAHFASKPPPPPKEKIPEKVVQHFVDLAKPAVEKRRSDYERSISKSYYQQKNSNRALQVVIKAGKLFPSSENRQCNRSPRSR